MGAPASSRTVAPGAVLLDRFRIGSILGAGTMGTVYEADDLTAPGSPVAVKVLAQDLVRDPDVQRRFARECAVLTSLSAPGIVRIVAQSADPTGPLFLVMERLRGEPLRARLARAPRPSAAEVAAWVAELASALDAAHAHGVVHGDIKPENVFLGDDGALKLLDFGMAKIIGLERLTRTGEVAGTPAYMAPELITGAHELDGRADIYALGVLAYELLAGTHPFRPKHPAQLLMAIVEGHRTPLREVRSGTSLATEQALDEALAKDADARASSALTFAERLRAALQAERPQGASPGPEPTGRR